MAGGEGAKERRRLKRLAAQEKKNKSENSLQKPVATEKSPASKNVRGDHNSERASNKSFSKRRAPDGQQRFNKNKKKPKIKKPKHLKRKLEQAAKENGEAIEVIQKEIEQFEAKKKFYSKSNRNAKRQKTADVEDHGNNDGIVSRLNKLNHNVSPFPRSDKVEIEKPAVIEADDSTETMDDKETTEAKDVTRKDVPTATNTESDEDSTHSSSDDESVDHDVADGKTSSESIEAGSEDKSNQSSRDNDGSSDDSSSNSDDDSDDDSDNDSDNDSDDDEIVQQRQRGRRRRGRQDTAKAIGEMEAAEQSKTPTSSNDKSKNEREDNVTKNGKKRYCIGRKPVTDFVLGQSYPGKVVYVKPFGVFFDIGCHSDAFCHVSRLSDDFVKSPESKFKEGDEVPKVRIVEIDRKQKRITVSLQSEARIKDERESIEARKSRKEKRKNKSKKAASIGSSGHDRAERSDQNYFISKEPAVNRANPAPAPAKKNLDPSAMTPAELKRARKLARRAERRAQAEQEQSQDS